jgi:hypothetical protein
MKKYYSISIVHIVFPRSMLWLLVSANVPNLQILDTLIIEVIHSLKVSDLIRATWYDIPEDGILHSHRRENLKSYIALTGWTLWQRHNMSPVRYKLGFLYPRRRHSS